MGSPPFIPARWFTRGRLAPVDLLVLHTAEGARTVAELGHYFQTTMRQASAHSGVDDHGRADYVRFADTAYGAPPCNADGEHLELCGFKAWTRAEWIDLHEPMLDQAAAWVAERAKAHGIPLNVLGRDALLRKERGITGHSAISATWHLTDHTDPGPGLPVDIIRSKAGALLRAPRKVGPVTIKPKPVIVTRTPIPPLARTMVIGAHGTDVAALQRRLRARGWTITRDGVYGPATAGVVRAFQEQHHLTADGRCGPQTWHALWALRIDLSAVTPS